MPRPATPGTQHPTSDVATKEKPQEHLCCILCLCFAATRSMATPAVEGESHLLRGRAQGVPAKR
eukprot:scaffold1352_cov261-Pinguiococcus_pyrenoidosus.AAC.17